MISTLEDFLLHAIKITDSEGGQLLTKIVANYTYHLQKLGVNNAQTRIDKILEGVVNYNPYDIMLGEEQNRLLMEVSNFVCFFSVMSSKNLQDDRQLDLLHIISCRVRKIIHEKDELKSIVTTITNKIKNGEIIKLYNSVLELRTKVKERIESDKLLRIEFLDYMLHNFEIIKDSGNSWQKDFTSLIIQNKDLFKREIIPQSIIDKINKLIESMDYDKAFKRCFFKFIVKFCILKTIGCKKRFQKNNEINQLKEIVSWAKACKPKEINMKSF